MSPKSSGKRYPAKIKREAVLLYKQKKWTLSKICSLKRMPSNIKVVRAWLVEAGCQIRPRPPIYPRKEILKKLEKGIPRAKLCKKYGCSEKYLSNLATGRVPVEQPMKAKRS